LAAAKQSKPTRRGYRNEAAKRIARFTGWLDSVPALRETIRTNDETFAVAQHYGIPP